MSSWSAVIPLRGKPKARPRVTRNGTFMPADYRKWRREFGALLEQAKPPNFPGPVELHLWFDTDDVTISVKSLEGVARPKFVRADVDNLVGAVMEVLEDKGIVTNDRMVLRIVASAAVKEDER